MRHEDIRNELIININYRMKENKQKHKEHVQGISDERLSKQAVKQKSRARRSIGLYIKYLFLNRTKQLNVDQYDLYK